MGQERWMRPEPFFLPGGVGFYRGLFAMALLVCGFFMFRETPLPQGFAHSDKVAHVGCFLVLALLAYPAMHGRVDRAWVCGAVGGLLALALGSEWVQGARLPLWTMDRGMWRRMWAGAFWG